MKIFSLLYQVALGALISTCNASTTSMKSNIRSRNLDAARGTPSPTDVPTVTPTIAPSLIPSVSHQPSLSLEPTLPHEECAGDLPFCWDGSEYGWGYVKCFAIESTEHCTSYDFQIAGTNYSNTEIIDFSHCASVWTWFLHCIEYSFPSCSHPNYNGFYFRHQTYSKFQVTEKIQFNKPPQYEFRMDGNGGDCYGDNCNVGPQIWNCDDEDDAWAIYAFARWVAGYRNDEKDAAISLFSEPDHQCATPAPSTSVAPTASPAPTFDAAPRCDTLDQPEWIPYDNTTHIQWTTRRNYMPVTWLINSAYGVRADGSICIYENHSTQARYNTPLPWLNDAAQSGGGTLTIADGKLNAGRVRSETIVLDVTSDVYTVTIQESEALAGGDLQWSFDEYPESWKNSAYATKFYDLLVKMCHVYPLIWETDPDQGLFCGSGAFCYDKNPNVRSYIAAGDENCGVIDYIVDDGMNEPYSTGDVEEWFVATVDKAFGCEVRESAEVFGYKFEAYMGRWYNPWEDVHYVNFGCHGSIGGWLWACPTEESTEMLDDFFQVARDARLFGMQPTECTAAPTASPTACTDSFFTTPPLNILLVVDTSYSTYQGTFETPVGDQNNDGKEDTIMDAEIAAAKALLNTIIETDQLNNDNVNIGLVLFDTEAKYLGNFNPTNSTGDGINDDLLRVLTNISIDADPNVVIDNNLGFTNMDDALDKAILYFEDESRPDFGASVTTNLMVFMGDGKPNVRGDGDGEVACEGVTGCEGLPADLVDLSLPLWEQSPLSFCTSGDTLCDSNPFKACVLGETCLDDSQTKQYDSELARLDEFKVHRLSIGVGDKSDVSVDSALWIIDNNPMKITHGLLPRQVLDADDLITALADLCPENTPNPTDMPSVSPTRFPTRSPTMAPTRMPSASPTRRPSPSPTADFCKYNVIEFSMLNDGETASTSGNAMFPLEWVEYGLSIRAQPYTEAHPVAARYELVETVEYEGMTLVVPQEDASAGGDLIITLDQTQAKAMELHLWNVLDGGTVTALDEDGLELRTQFVSPGAGDIQVIEVTVTNAYVIVISLLGEGGLAQLMVCQDPVATAAPVGLAPPSGSLETRPPTESPTPGGGTTAPAPAPTSTPTGSTEVNDISTCPEDIELLVITPEDGKAFDFAPLSIVERDGSSVTLELSKGFTETMSFIYVEYTDGRTNECVGFEDFLTSMSETITAKCMEMAPLTVVNIYVSDSSLVSGDAEIPKCCHHPLGTTLPVVEYTFKVYCESQCSDRG
eukprot:Nitzschia sp. Nitz4//scaffold410_size10010//2943//7146//NITZ4_009085-RA/size10010-snap-gene-0.9-mRNA-1//1//CDS//3329551310//5312//frame0